VLAGLPSDAAVVAAFRNSGFDEFIHARANAQRMLGNFLSKLGSSL
jgi:methylmalonyl-CoA mutase